MRKRVVSAWPLASSMSPTTSQKHASSSSFTSSSSDFLPSVDSEETPPLLRRVLNRPLSRARINSSHVGGNSSCANAASRPLSSSREEDSFFFADGFSPRRVTSVTTSINDTNADNDYSMMVLGGERDESTTRPVRGEDIYQPLNTRGPSSSSSTSHSTKLTTEGENQIGGLSGAPPRRATLHSSTSSTEAMTIRSFITAGSATAVRESTQRLLQLFLSLQYRVHRCLPPELENTSVDYRELLGLPLSYSIGRGGVEGAVFADQEEEGRSTSATTHANASTRHRMKTNACDTSFWNRDNDGDTISSTGIMREAMCSDANRLHEYVVANVVRGDSTGTCTGIITATPPTVVVSVWEAIFIACEMHHARHGQYLEAVMLAASETLSLSNAPTTVTATAAEVAVRGGSGVSNESNNNTNLMDDRRYDDHDDGRTIAERTSSALFPSYSSADSQSRLVSSSTNNGYGKMNENENAKETNNNNNNNNNKSKPHSHLRVPYLHSVAIKLFRCLRYYRSRQSHTASTMATSAASTLASSSSTTTTTITIDDDAFYGRCACRVLSILASLSSLSSSATTTTTTAATTVSRSSLVSWSFLIYDVLQETPHVVSALERNDEQAGNSRDLLSAYNKNSRATVLEGGVLVTTSSPQQVEDTTGKTSSPSREPLPDSVAAPIPTFSFARKYDENDAKKTRGTAEVGGKADEERSGGALLPPLTPSQALVVFMARLIDDTVDEFLLLANKEGGGKHEIHRRREAQTHHGNHHGNHHDFILCSVTSSYSDAPFNTYKQQREVEGEGSPPLRHGADKNNKKKKILKTPETATLAPRSSVVDVRYERNTHSTCKSSSGSSGAEMDVYAADALLEGTNGHAKQSNRGRFVVEERRTVGREGGGGGEGFLPSILNSVMQSERAKMSSSFGGSSPSKGSAAGGNKKSAPLRWRGSDRRLRQRSPILIETLIGTVASMCLSERTLTVLLTSPAAAAANCSSAQVGVATTSIDKNSGGAYFCTPFSSSAAMALVSGPQAALILLEEVLLNLRFSSSSSHKGTRSVTVSTERGASSLLPPTTEQKRRPFFSSLFASSSSLTIGDSSDSPAALAAYTSTGNKTTSLAILHAAAQAAAEREKAEALKGGLMVTADSYDGTCAPQMALHVPFAAANHEQQQLPSNNNNTCILPLAVLTLLNTYFAPVASRLLLIDHNHNDSGGCGGTLTWGSTTSSSSSSAYSSDYELLTRLVFLLYRAFGSIAAHSNSVADSASAMLLALAMRSLYANSATAAKSRVTCTGTGTTASLEGATSLALPQATVTPSAENPAANVKETESTSTEREDNKAGAHQSSRHRANFPFYSSSSLAFSASTLDFSIYKRSLPRCGQSVELYLRIKDGVPLIPTRAILAKESLRAVLSEVRTRSDLERALARSLREQQKEELASDHEAGFGTSTSKRRPTAIIRVDDDLRLASLRRSFATHSEDVGKIIQLILVDFSSSSSSSSLASCGTPRPSNAVILDLLATASAILEELAITMQSVGEAESRAAVEDVDIVGGTACSVSDANNNTDNKSGLLYAEARRRLPPMLGGVISSSSYPSSLCHISTSSSFPFLSSSSLLSSSSCSAIEEVQLWLLHSFSSSLLAFTLSSSAADSAVCGSSAVSKKKGTADDAQSEELTAMVGTARSFFASVFFSNNTKTGKCHAETTGGSGNIQHRHAHAHRGVGGGAHLYYKGEEEEDLKRLYVLYCSSAVLFSRYLSLSAATSTPSAASFVVDVNERHHQEENKEELAAVENVLDAVTQELIAAATIIPRGVTATTKYGQTDVSSGAKSTIIGKQKMNPSSLFSLRSSFASFACAVRWLVPKWRESVSPPIPLFPLDTVANNNNKMKKGRASSTRRPLFLEFSEACASPHAIFGGNEVGSGKSSSTPLMGGRKSIFSFSEVPPIDGQNTLITESPAQHLLMQMTEAVLAFTHIHTTAAKKKRRASDADDSTIARAEDRQQQQEQWRMGGGRVAGFPCLYPFWPLQDFTVPLLQLIDGTLVAFSFVSDPSDVCAVDAVNTARNGNVSLLAEGTASSSNRYASFPSFLSSMALNILTNSSVRTAPPPPLLLLRDRSNRCLVEQQQQHSRGKEDEEEEEDVPPLHAFHLLQQRVCRQLAEKMLLLQSSPTLSCSSCSSFRTTGAFSWSTLESVAVSCCCPAQMAAAAKSISMTHTSIATRRVLTVLVELPTVEHFLLSCAPYHGDGFLCSNKKAPLLDVKENGMEIADEMMRRNAAHSLSSSTSRSRNQMAIEMIKKELAGGRERGGEWKKGGPLHVSPSRAPGGGQQVKNTKEHQHQYGGDTKTVKDSNKNVPISAIVNALLDEMNQVAFNCCEHVFASASTALTNTTRSSGSDELRAKDSVDKRTKTSTTTTTTERDFDETEVHFHFTFPAALALPVEVREALFQHQEQQEARDGHMLTRPLRTTILPTVERRVPCPSPSSHRPTPAAVSLFASVIQPEVPYVRNGRAYGTALAGGGGGGGDGTIQPEVPYLRSTAPLKEDREIILLTTGRLSSSSSSSASFKAPHMMMGTEMGGTRSGEKEERNSTGGSTNNRTPSPMLEAIERLVVRHMSATTTTSMIGGDEESGTEEEHSAKSQGRTLFLWSSSVVPKSDKKKEEEPPSREYGGTSSDSSDTDDQSMEVAKEGEILSSVTPSTCAMALFSGGAVAAPPSPPRRAKEVLRSLIVIPIMASSASAFASHRPCRKHFAPSASGQTTSAPTTTTAALAAVGSSADNTANTTPATCADTRTRGSTPLAVSSSSSSVFKTSGFTSRKRHPSASTSPSSTLLYPRMM